MTKPQNIFFTAQASQGRDALWSKKAQQRAKELGYNIRLNQYESVSDNKQWAQLLEGVDALITTWQTPCLNEEVLAKNTTLKIVGHAGGSVATIVSPELYKRRVKVTTANYEMAASIAEWSVMMTLAGVRQIINSAQFGNKYPMQWDNRHRGMGIHDAVVGIWGFGDIAKHLICFLKPLNPKEIIVCDEYLTLEKANELGIRKVEFDDLFAQADVLHVLTSLTEKNKERIGAEQLKLIKPGATLVNAGRAAMIQYDALLTELEKQRFYAIMDVHYVEPLPPDYAFRKLPNVILTPHNAGWGRNDSFIVYVLNEFERFFNGEPLLYEISEERAKMMTREGIAVDYSKKVQAGKL